MSPSNYTDQVNRAVALYGAGHAAEAISLLVSASAIGDGDLTAHLNLARIFRMRGEWVQAREWLDRARILRPDSFETYFELGQVYLDERSFAAAAEQFSASLALQPGNVEALLQLAACLLNLRKSEEALGILRKAAATAPHDVRVHQGMMLASKLRDDIPGVISSVRAVLSIEPENRAALRELLGAAVDRDERSAVRSRLQILCRTDSRDIADWKAVAASVADDLGYERGIEILEEGIERTNDVSLRLHRALMFPKISQSHAQITAVRVGMERHLDAIIDGPDQRIANLVKSVNRTAFRLAYHGENDRALMEKLARAHLKVAPDLAWTAAHIGRASVRPRLRIGFLSAFFHAHSVGDMMRGVIRDLDRERFEVVVIRIAGTIDEAGLAIDRSADAVLTIPVNLVEARAKIAALELDVLVYADIGMEPFSYYLAFGRLARAQIVWPGHPVTTGLSSIDAYISGRSAEPDGCQNHYTEKLICFAKVPIYDESRDLRAGVAFKREFGLEGQRLYACPMALQKFHPDMDRLLQRIVARDPDARLVIFGAADATMETLTKRMLESAPGLEGRLVSLPWLKRRMFAAMLQEADAVIDTLHFSGSGTSRYAAAAGALTITLEGHYMRGRLTAGMLSDMGLAELVPQSEDAYADLAVSIANDPPRRAQLSMELKDASNRLRLDKSILREFEQCFTDVFQAMSAGS